MNVTLDIENADIDLIKALKSVIKLHPNVKFKIKEKKLSNLDRAIKEIENGEVESFSDFESYQKAMEEIRK